MQAGADGGADGGAGLDDAAVTGHGLGFECGAGKRARFEGHSEGGAAASCRKAEDDRDKTQPAIPVPLPGRCPSMHAGRWGVARSSSESTASEPLLRGRMVEL